MDQHPLTPKCPSTLKLVAFGYLCACYGSSLPEEYAPITGRSRRQRIAINPAALSLFSYDGAFSSFCCYRAVRACRRSESASNMHLEHSLEN